MKANGRRDLSIAIALAVGAAMGCDGGSAPVDGGRIGLDVGGAATITMHGTLAELIGAVPSETIHVCVYQAPSIACADTDETGAYVMSGIPADVDLAISLRDDAGNYQPLLEPIHTPSADFVFSPLLFPATVADDLGAMTGIPIDPTRSVVWFYAAGTSGGQANVTVALEPSDADASAYIMGRFTPSTTQTATNLSGLGLFINVPEGEHTLRFLWMGAVCGPTPGAWQTSTPGALRTPVVPGYWSIVGASGCH